MADAVEQIEDIAILLAILGLIGFAIYGFSSLQDFFKGLGKDATDPTRVGLAADNAIGQQLHPGNGGFDPEQWAANQGNSDFAPLRNFISGLWASNGQTDAIAAGKSPWDVVDPTLGPSAPTFEVANGNSQPAVGTEAYYQDFIWNNQ